MSLYDDLGVARNADKDVIKRAYRKRVHKAHPDKGGRAEEFHAIQRAYDVLSDDARRAHYDQHGTDGAQDRQGMLMHRLAALLAQMVETQDIEHADIVRLMREALDGARGQTQEQIRKVESKIARYERSKKRLRRKGDGENVLAQMLDGQISALRRALEMGKSEVQNIADLLTMLDAYSYEVDKQGVRTTLSFNGLGATWMRP